jgi:hypothetical protein
MNAVAARFGDPWACMHGCNRKSLELIFIALPLPNQTTCR